MALPESEPAPETPIKPVIEVPRLTGISEIGDGTIMFLADYYYNLGEQLASYGRHEEALDYFWMSLHYVNELLQTPAQSAPTPEQTIAASSELEVV